MIPKDAKGLRLSIYKFHLGDCTAGGVSGGDTKDLTLVGYRDVWVGGDQAECQPLDGNLRAPFLPTEDAPAVILVNRRLFGSGPSPCLVPAVLKGEEWVPEPRWVMAGGNLAGTCDSRWHALLEGLGLPRFIPALDVHDRIENK